MISVGRDGLLVKIAPAILNILGRQSDEELAAMAGLPVDQARELAYPILLGRAAGSVTADVCDAMIREWRERDDAQERHIHGQRKGRSAA